MVWREESRQRRNETEVVYSLCQITHIDKKGRLYISVTAAIADKPSSWRSGFDPVGGRCPAIYPHSRLLTVADKERRAIDAAYAVYAETEAESAARKQQHDWLDADFLTGLGMDTTEDVITKYGADRLRAAVQALKG